MADGRRERDNGEGTPLPAGTEAPGQPEKLVAREAHLGGASEQGKEDGRRRPARPSVGAEGQSAGIVPMTGRQLWRVVPLLKPYKGRVAVGLAANAVARFFDLLPLLVIGLAVDRFASAIQGENLLAPADFYLFGGLIFATFIGLAVSQTLSDYAWDTLAQKVRHDLRVRIYEHLQRQEVRYFEDRQVGDLLAVLSNDVDNLENFLSDATTSIIRLVVTFIGVFAILFFLDWRLALLLAAPLPFAILAVRFFATRVTPQYRRTRQAVADINSIVENNLSGISVIQAYTAEGHQADRIRTESGHYRDAAIDTSKSRAMFIPMLYVLAGVGYSALLGIGGWMLFLPNGPSIGDYVAFVLYSMRLIMPLFILGILINQIHRSEASARRIFEVLDRPPAIHDRKRARRLAGPVEEIAFDDVRFRYTPEVPVLNGVSLRLEPGKMIGIVGPTGAGKSTLIKLLLRHYEPGSGRIAVNGVSLKDLRMGDLRRRLGYVSQDAFLFQGTVEENIKLGAPQATRDEVTEAAAIAGAHEFIERLPQGYDTLVGPRGVKLSGGQKQRVSLARAILRDPAVLVLDEATSAVDTRTEEIIQRNLKRFAEGRMTLAVAHRLSTIRHADEILVLVDGVVTERGTHQELVARGGVYADLWNVQSGALAKAA